MALTCCHNQALREQLLAATGHRASAEAQLEVRDGELAERVAVGAASSEGS